MTTQQLQRFAPWTIGAFRIVVGFLFLCHGASKLISWPVPPGSGSSATFGMWPMWWAGVIEVLVGALLIFGIGTRVVALIGSGHMAVAYFWQHQPDGLLPLQNNGEAAVLFCWALLLLVFIGPGKFAVENSFRRSQRTPEVPVDQRTPEPAL